MNPTALSSAYLAVDPLAVHVCEVGLARAGLHSAGGRGVRRTAGVAAAPAAAAGGHAAAQLWAQHQVRTARLARLTRREVVGVAGTAAVRKGLTPLGGGVVEPADVGLLTGPAGHRQRAHVHWRTGPYTVKRLLHGYGVQVLLEGAAPHQHQFIQYFSIFKETASTSERGKRMSL